MKLLSYKATESRRINEKENSLDKLWKKVTKDEENICNVTKGGVRKESETIFKGTSCSKFYNKRHCIH